MAASKTTKSVPKPKQPQWIAERRLERSDGVGGIVIVRIGSPERPPGAKEWRCPFMFEGLGDDSIHFGMSIDSMAALQNALIGIRELLERTGIPLRWEGFDEDFTGFPKHIPWTYGLELYQRIEKIIEVEIEELVRPIRERHERLAAQRKGRKKPHAK
ncbi:MAG: hypothetical protein IPM54_42685 [Polyangiaceae bacterium]|nr:hypothetical protein [Polyangiaceae bacterium]